MKRLPFLLTTLATACGAPLATPGAPSAGLADDLTLRTDRSAYEATIAQGRASATYVFTLIARFTNHTDRAVYLERCYPETPYPVHGIVAAAGEAEPAYAPVWACVGPDRAIEVAPGATRTDSLRITGPHVWDGTTNEPFGTLEGRFRLRYTVGICAAVAGCDAPGRTVDSNEFHVRLQ